MRRLTWVAAAGVATALALGWFLVARVPNWFGPRVEVAPAAPATSDMPVRKIRARLFYVSADGLRLEGVDRDVRYGATPAEQADALIREQLEPAPPPLLNALPEATRLRGVFLTPEGDAYVDLSQEASSAHIGGSLDELFAVYTVVNVLTVNLPAIARVQILIDGKEVDSLAGHIDLRHPLPRSDRWSTVPPAAAPQAPPASPAPETSRGTIP